jgi:hypothetical protein
VRGEALRESEARERARVEELEGILEAAPVAMFISQDPDCRNMIGSKLTYEMLRISPGLNISKSAPDGQAPATFRAIRSGQEIPHEEFPAQRAAATGQPVRNYEFYVVYEDGTYRNLLGEAIPLFGEDGNPRGAVGVLWISPNVSGVKRGSARPRSWKALACSREELPMTSTTSSPE